jgi:hypothetical protein
MRTDTTPVRHFPAHTDLVAEAGTQGQAIENPWFPVSRE